MFVFYKFERKQKENILINLRTNIRAHAPISNNIEKKQNNYNKLQTLSCDTVSFSSGTIERATTAEIGVMKAYVSLISEKAKSRGRIEDMAPLSKEELKHLYLGLPVVINLTTFRNELIKHGFKTSSIRELTKQKHTTSIVDKVKELAEAVCKYGSIEKVPPLSSKEIKAMYLNKENELDIGYDGFRKHIRNEGFKISADRPPEAKYRAVTKN